MKNETKNCQNCKQNFTIESEDFNFYEKIKVPPPTFCPECRLQRRLAWRNEKVLFRRQCDAPGHSETIISMYVDGPDNVVYDSEYWNSDSWDPLDYGIDYNFSLPFFTQWKNLFSKVPLLTLFDSKSVNDSYCNITTEHKNCYMVSAGWINEDSLYSNRISSCIFTGDALMCHKLDSCYECVLCKDSNKLYFSLSSENCAESYFLYDCRNCLNCIGCTNLRNKSYCIFNQQYTKEEYYAFLQENNLEDRNVLDKLNKKFKELYNNAIHRYAHLLKTENVVGDDIENSRNCYYCFGLAGNAENAKYCHWGTYGLKDSYDTGPGTGGKSELTYEGTSIGVANSMCAFGVIVWNSSNVYYSFGVQNCTNCFGCVSLKNKSYCIFNNQYTKDEYENILPKIIKHMNDLPYIDKKGRTYGFGEFFPIELSPYPYNATVGNDYCNIDEKFAKDNFYPWFNKENSQNQYTVKNKDIPSSLGKIEESLINEILECKNSNEDYSFCTKGFKLTQKEIDFYRKMKVPIPIFCFNCRHNNRVQMLKPMKLWHRQCMNQGCKNEFETAYAPDRPEIVYCERCYQQEVY